MDSSSLQRLGLNVTESKVYLFLLQNGPCYATQIQTALQLQKVPAYRALNTLKAQSLVDSLGESRNQRFVAQPLDILLRRYDEQIETLATGRASLQTLMRTLADQQSDLYKQNNVQLYEGINGYRLWNEERLRGDVKIIRECGRDNFLHEFFSVDEVHEYMQRYITRRVAKGIHIRTLHDSSEPVIDYDRSDPAKLKQARSTKLPENLDAFLSIFGNRIGFYTRQGGRYLGVIIDDPMMARTLEWLYDSLWQQSKSI